MKTAAAESSTQSNSFTDILSMEQVETEGAHSSIIKKNRIAVTDAHPIEIHSGQGNQQPTIVTHKDGDTITAIEVVCPCGCSTTISLDY